MRGRRIGTSWAALTFLTAITWVTNLVGRRTDARRQDRSPAPGGRWRRDDLDHVAEGTATKPCTC